MQLIFKKNITHDFIKVPSVRFSLLSEPCYIIESYSNYTCPDSINHLIKTNYTGEFVYSCNELTLLINSHNHCNIDLFLQNNFICKLRSIEAIEFELPVEFLPAYLEVNPIYYNGEQFNTDIVFNFSSGLFESSVIIPTITTYNDFQYNPLNKLTMHVNTHLQTEISIFIYDDKQFFEGYAKPCFDSINFYLNTLRVNTQTFFLPIAWYKPLKVQTQKHNYVLSNLLKRNQS